MASSRLYCAPKDFVLRLRQRMPMNVGFTFTDEQLVALSNAFGDRFDAQHAVDVRGRLYLPWSRYYVVFQAGRDRRTDLRRTVAAELRRTAVDTALCGIAVSAIVAGGAWLALRFLA